MKRLFSIFSLIGILAMSLTSCDAVQDIVDELTDSATAKVNGADTSFGLYTQYKLEGDGNTQVAIITLANVAIADAGGKVINLVIPSSKLKAGETTSFSVEDLIGVIDDPVSLASLCAYFPAITIADAIEIGSRQEIEAADNIDRFVSSSVYAVSNTNIEYTVTINTVDGEGNISGTFSFVAAQMDGAGVTEEIVTITEGTFENVGLND